MKNWECYSTLNAIGERNYKERNTDPHAEDDEGVHDLQLDSSKGGISKSEMAEILFLAKFLF